VTTTNESTDRQWSLHQDSTPYPAIGVMPSFACHGCTQTEQVFALNLGIFVKSFYEAVWGRPLNGFATEADCDVSVRLGALMQGKPFGDANDKWWTINGTPQCNNSLGSEIQSALVGVGIPFLDRFSEYNIIAEHLKQVKGWQSKNPLIMIYRALAEWKNGKSKVASETLSGIKGKSWESKVNAIQEVIGVGS
jgi:hypothetical protein